MESEIKLKATREEYETVCQYFCVKACYDAQYIGEGKNRFLYKILLRHAEDAGRLRGTYTAAGLVKKLSPIEKPDVPNWFVKRLKSYLDDVEHLFGKDCGVREAIAEMLKAA